MPEQRYATTGWSREGKRPCCVCMNPTDDRGIDRFTGARDVPVHDRCARTHPETTASLPFPWFVESGKKADFAALYGRGASARPDRYERPTPGHQAWLSEEHSGKLSRVAAAVSRDMRHIR